MAKGGEMESARFFTSSAFNSNFQLSTLKGVIGSMESINLKEPKLTNNVEMARELHRFIGSGDIFKASRFIQNLSQSERHKLTQSNQEHGIIPAIFIAIEKRKFWSVKFLVKMCDANIEEQASCKIGSEMTDDTDMMSPLELAFARKESKIIEFLLSVGADATRLLKNKQTVVAACQLHSFKTVQLLAEQGADLNATGQQGFSGLMHAVRNVDLCRYLLDKGVNVNSQNDCGQTALHIAARDNHCDSVKLLIENGADPFLKNVHGDDSFQVASLHSSEETMNFFMETVFRDVTRQIEAYQLLGVNFLTYGHDIAKAFFALKKAITLSAEKQIQITATRLNTPFGTIVESTSPEEYDDLSRNDDQICMQAIILTHKILGRAHHEFYNTIRSVADLHFQQGLFEQWLHLQIYSFQISRDFVVDAHERCLRFEHIFSKICSCIAKHGASIVTLTFSTISEFLEAVVPNVLKCIDIGEYEVSQTLVFLMIRLFMLAKCENHQKLEFQALVRIVIKAIDQKDACERTLLMEAVCSYLHNNDVPVLDIVAMLLECGADVNARDKQGSNVVHFVHAKCGWQNVGCGWRNRTMDVLRRISVKCFEFGIHLDARNHQGNDTASCLRELGIRAI